MNKNNQKNVTFYYERAIDKDDLGDLKGAIEDFSKAIEDFSKAIEIDPEDPINYFNRGNSR